MTDVMAGEGLDDEPLDGELLPSDEPLSSDQRARLRGWKPLAEFLENPRNKAEDWRDAEEFLAVADGDNRLLRENTRRLERQVHKLQGQITTLTNSASEQLEALREMRQIAAKNDQRGYDRAKRELLDQRAEAIAAADTTAFDQVEQQIEALGSRPADPPAPAPPPPPAPAAGAEIPQEVADFIEDNPWYVKDTVLNRTMIATYDIVARRNPRWTIAQVLEESKARTMAEYPEKFPGEVSADPPPPPPPRRPGSAVRPSLNPPRHPRAASGWDQIADPDERRQAEASFQRQQRADPGLTAGEFLALYLDPHADVLALRAQRKA